jgi:hypothetical protein
MTHRVERFAQNESRVARFFLTQHTKTGKIGIPNDHKTYQSVIKYTGQKVYQMARKYTK